MWLVWDLLSLKFHLNDTGTLEYSNVLWTHETMDPRCLPRMHCTVFVDTSYQLSCTVVEGWWFGLLAVTESDASRLDQTESRCNRTKIQTRYIYNETSKERKTNEGFLTVQSPNLGLIERWRDLQRTAQKPMSAKLHKLKQRCKEEWVNSHNRWDTE